MSIHSKDTLALVERKEFKEAVEKLLKRDDDAGVVTVRKSDSSGSSDSTPVVTLRRLSV